MKKNVILYLTLCLFITGAISVSGKNVLFENSFEVSKGELLDVSTDNGDIKISAWDNNEVALKIYGNKKAADVYKFSAERTNSGVEIKVDKIRGGFSSWFSNENLDFEIRIPREFATKIKTAGGDITISDVTGEQVMRTSGGDIEIYNIFGQVQARTSGGKIIVDKHEGELVLGTSGGDIILKSQKGNADVKTSAGDVKVDIEDGSIVAATSGGDVELHYKGENRGIELRTSGGDIKLYLPENIKGELNCSTSGGEVSNEMDNSRVYKSKSSSLEASLNGGGESIRARTSGGDITIKSY